MRPTTFLSNGEVGVHEDGANGPGADGDASRVVPTLVGRDEVVDHVTQILRRPDVRLVTVTGLSGVGKSALVATVAASIEAEDGVGVPRAQVDRHAPAAAVDEVRAALALPVAGPAGPVPAGRRRLVLLDGLEAVPDAPDAIAQALADDEGLTVLAASIIPLSIPGERVIRLDPLALPDLEETSDKAFRDAPAVRLLLDRIAEHTGRDAADDVAAAVELARVLGGLPLALELAAARCSDAPVATVLDEVRRLDPIQVLDRERNAGVEAREPTVPAHHRSLRATILWSFGLLDQDERRVARRLGVFAGTFGRTAAAVVASATDSDLDRLVAAGLVRAVGRSAVGDRFELVPSVSLVARELLSADGELDATEDRHAEHFRSVASESRAMLCSPAAADVRRELLADVEDVVGAVRHLTRCGRHQDALAVMADLALLWEAPSAAALAAQLLEELFPDTVTTGIDSTTAAEVAALAAMVAVLGQQPADRRGGLAERLDRAAVAVRATGSTSAVLMVLRAQVASHLLQGQPDDGVVAADEGLATARELDDDWWTCQFLGWCAAARTMCGDAAAALAHATEGRDLALLTGDAAQLLRMSHLLVGIGGLRPETDGAPMSVDDLIALARRVDDPNAEGVLRVGQAVVDAVGGDIATSSAHLLAALDVGRRSGLWYIEELALLATVMLATLGGRPGDAARLHGGLSEVLANLEKVIAPESMQLYLASVERACTDLGPDEFERSVARGRFLDWEEAVTLCAVVCDELSATGLPPAQAVRGPLSPRQSEVLALLAVGHTNKEIAAVLGMRPKTVMHHTSEIYRRLGVRNRTEAVAEGRRLGVIVERSTSS
jgi:DNA-binding CsgD family transcriptional regulator/predicted ATPase